MIKKRLIMRTESNGREAKIYRDSEWQEYVVKFSLDGHRLPDADYFTEDKEDAVSTARNFVATTDREKFGRESFQKDWDEGWINPAEFTEESLRHHLETVLGNSQEFNDGYIAEFNKIKEVKP